MEKNEQQKKRNTIRFDNNSINNADTVLSLILFNFDVSLHYVLAAVDVSVHNVVFVVVNVDGDNIVLSMKFDQT